jgi:hypothetical protein
MSRSDVIATRLSGWARLEHDPGGPLEDSTRARADQRAPDQGHRQIVEIVLTDRLQPEQ